MCDNVDPVFDKYTALRQEYIALETAYQIDFNNSNVFENKINMKKAYKKFISYKRRHLDNKFIQFDIANERYRICLLNMPELLDMYNKIYPIKAINEQ